MTRFGFAPYGLASIIALAVLYATGVIGAGVYFVGLALVVGFDSGRVFEMQRSERDLRARAVHSTETFIAETHAQLHELDDDERREAEHALAAATNALAMMDAYAGPIERWRKRRQRRREGAGL
jgi:hypothetical protein